MDKENTRRNEMKNFSNSAEFWEYAAKITEEERKLPNFETLVQPKGLCSMVYVAFSRGFLSEILFQNLGDEIYWIKPPINLTYDQAYFWAPYVWEPRVKAMKELARICRETNR